MKRIAIIGGGAKAAALCAKAACINEYGNKLELTVFERSRLGSAWTGKFGYTDGEQNLCTPAERDVGFPYQEGLLDAEGVQSLYARFSWASFLIQQGENEYRDWVDRGRRRPTHRLYADYLQWVIKTAGAKRKMRQVTRLSRRAGKWAVGYDYRGAAKVAENFDGLVVTGPGPALKGFDRPNDPRLTNGVDFWRDPETFLAQRRNDDAEPIVIAGSGGTAAAIAAFIAKTNSHHPILIVGNQAALFTRTESFFENALFSDEDAWAALDAKERIGASERLNRGVVWSSVSDVLSASSNIRFRPGRVIRAKIAPPIDDGAPDELRLEVKNAAGIAEDSASLVIDAAGFDQWWFVDLFPPAMKARTEGQGVLTTVDQRAHLKSAMNTDLSIDLGVGRIHAPMLSQSQGPGFGSLMVLGAMSDRILKPYIDG